MAILELLMQSGLQQLFYGFFLPFVLTFVIVWGALTVLKLFGRRINLIIAIVITLFFANTDQFVVVTSFFSQLASTLLLVVFFGVFVAGAVIYGYGKTKSVKDQYLPPSHRIKNIDKEIAKLKEQYEDEDDSEKRKRIVKRIAELESERKERRIEESM